MKQKKRKWMAYEKNWLLKHGFSIGDLSQYGNTPVEYIVGLAPFYQREFKVNQSVLIPRSETEELVTLALKTIQQNFSHKKKLEIVEVGTGSGVIAITLLLQLVKMGFSPQIIALDISKDALEVASSNALLFLKKKDNCYHQKNGRLEFRQSDLLSKVNAKEKPDLIVANLPYIPSNLMKELPPEVSNFEPHLALNGGENGLALVKKMIKQAKKKFDTLPSMLLEIDSRSNLDLIDFNLDLENTTVIKDRYSKQRFIKFISKKTS